VEEKLKAGCDDTKCLMEVAGALDIGLIVTGDISKFGDLYTLSLQLISTRGANLGVVQRASEECECSEQQLVDLSKRVALKLIGKTPSPPVVAASQHTSAPSAERFTNSIGQEFVYIKPGTFMMGSPANEPGRFDSERQHQVTLTRGYYLQTTEVTVGQWRSFVQATGYRSEAETGDGAYIWTGSAWEKRAGTYWDNPGFAQSDNQPVTCVSWNDVQKFIEWLSRKEGKQYRLPTEAEWEYAARAGTTGPYAGNLDSMGWYSQNSGSKTQPVARKQANAWGLYDMHGNVWEWVQDWYGDYPTGSVTDPTGPSSGSFRVLRGGSWFNGARYCRSATRTGSSPGDRYISIGFRLAADK